MYVRPDHQTEGHVELLQFSKILWFFKWSYLVAKFVFMFIFFKVISF